MKRSIDGLDVRSGPSSKPSKARHFVSAEDRAIWDAKLDAADIGNLGAAISVGVGGAVTLKSDASSVAINPATSLTLYASGTNVASSSNGTTFSTNVLLSAAAGASIAANQKLTIDGLLVMPIDSAPSGVTSLVLDTAGKKSFVDITSLLTGTPPALSFNAIDAGVATGGQVIYIGLFPASSADLIGSSSFTVSMGFDGTGAVNISADSPTSAPISTITGSDVTVVGGGILKFIYVPGFAGAARGAWVQL